VVTKREKTKKYFFVTTVVALTYSTIYDMMYRRYPFGSRLPSAWGRLVLKR
jgi:hypothetical protein